MSAWSNIGGKIYVLEEFEHLAELERLVERVN